MFFLFIVFVLNESDMLAVTWELGHRARGTRSRDGCLREVALDPPTKSLWWATR